MTEKIRALIVDDELPGLEGVRLLLVRDPEVEIVGECANGLDAIRAIETLAPHLLFLDVEMPEFSGFEVLEAIDKEKMPLVIFVTGHDEYARRAFDVHAVDYLSKPYSASRFEEALRRAKHRLRTESRDRISERTNAFLEERRPPYPPRLWVRDKRGSKVPVETDGIDWVDVDDHTVHLHVAGKFYDFRKSLSELEAQLDPQKFWRIERSHIVNIDRIAKIDTLSENRWEVVLRILDKETRLPIRLPMSREYRNRLIASGVDL